MGKLRSQTDTIYNSAEELDEAIKKEKAYAKSLGKSFDALTKAERVQALKFEPVVEKPPAKKKGKE